MIFLSLKTYKEATGDNAIKLLSCVKKIQEETRIEIIPAVQPTDIYRVKKELEIEVWAQHIDPIDPGKNFGWISPFSIKEAGANGVIINHSEHKISKELIIKTIEKAKKYFLKTLILTDGVDLAFEIEKYKPDFIGYEKENFIASGISMIDSEKDNIRILTKKLKTPLIVGAGINNEVDVKKSLELGAKGVILASAFIKAKDPESKLRELVLGFVK
ncbi:MAG: triose-phosphate isomerase [Patescibacteria group bacterium]|nr:triose-phosphate isomerase [Patescibacteria group bacterium]